MNMTLSEIAEITQGKLVGEDVAIASVSIDTRAIKPGQLYIAIKGENFDGNEFVAGAEAAGAIAAILHPGFSANIPYITVADTRLALAELAGAWRQKADVSVVGITGSNGKTTVKEMTAAILSAGEAGNDGVLFTQGNLNNDIGVPLTLLRLNENHRFAVIEMGANHAGEIAYTSHYTAADVVILNNAGAAHLEGFGSLDGVAKAKGEIIETLKADGVAVLNHGDTYFDYWLSVAGARKVLAFGFSESADVRANNIKTVLRDNAFVTEFELQTAQGNTTCTLGLAGKHNVLNALAATAAALALNISLPQIVKGLASMKPVTGRLQPLVGKLGNIVIDDTYNANANSLKAGLDVLSDCGSEAWLILGAFGEQGPDSPQIHFDLGKMIKDSGVVRLMALGADTINTVTAFGEGASYFESHDDLIAELHKELKGNESVLIKGSRSARMELVAAALVENYRKP